MASSIRYISIHAQGNMLVRIRRGVKKGGLNLVVDVEVDEEEEVEVEEGLGKINTGQVRGIASLERFTFRLAGTNNPRKETNKEAKWLLQ